ncbi:hypothetical protein D8674_033729 [Pyrus ussuriensis x Pyrus communis]|uniref:Uncharacterized protein n=1 Tax=Pyrus ussuriensis x Pyrus communis TaxID=2448454 RepID=A0A5N5HZX0_9ROSA|nr:hypothetical protein D8674_033729 [Pyrus ussuriensis x Pyrus communis]
MYEEHRMLTHTRSMHVETVKSRIHESTIRIRSASTRLKFHIPQSSTNMKSKKAEYQLELLGRQKKFPNAQLLRLHKHLECILQRLFGCTTGCCT